MEVCRLFRRVKNHVRWFAADIVWFWSLRNEEIRRRYCSGDYEDES